MLDEKSKTVTQLFNCWESSLLTVTHNHGFRRHPKTGRDFVFEPQASDGSRSWSRLYYFTPCPCRDPWRVWKTFESLTLPLYLWKETNFIFSVYTWLPLKPLSWSVTCSLLLYSKRLFLIFRQKFNWILLTFTFYKR